MGGLVPRAAGLWGERVSDPVGGTDSLAGSFPFVCTGQPGEEGREEGRKEGNGWPPSTRERERECVCL